MVMEKKNGRILVRMEEIVPAAAELRAGDPILLSGVIYTARDAAHKRLNAMLEMCIRDSYRPVSHRRGGGNRGGGRVRGFSPGVRRVLH